MNPTETPKDVCPHCGGGQKYPFSEENVGPCFRRFSCGFMEDSGINFRPDLCREREKSQKLEARLAEAEDLITGLHDGWKKARKAHLETCKNAQREIDKLHTENVCLQELIQEFYEWSRRDYPTEQEVREIMNRYYDLLNK